MSSPRVCIWTDGSSIRNPGKAGWAAVLIFGQRGRVIGGYYPKATNNQMEIEAVIQGLNALTKPCTVSIHTDSQYVEHGVEKIKTGSTLSTNEDWWLRFREAMKRHDAVHIYKVRAHTADDTFNNMADLQAYWCAEHQLAVDDPLYEEHFMGHSPCSSK